MSSERVQAVEVDIDCRIAALWVDTWAPDGVLADLDEAQSAAMAAVARAAYARGYVDALQEDREGRRAELQRTHGYRED